MPVRRQSRMVNPAGQKRLGLEHGAGHIQYQNRLTSLILIRHSPFWPDSS
jgi:hypothetical protein